MAKSEEIPIVTPSQHREYDNPFNDQTAFSPPQTTSLFERMTGGGGGGGLGDKQAEFVEGRERSASQPNPTNLRDYAAPPFSPHEPSPLLRSESERGNSNPNLTTTRFSTPAVMHPINRMHSMPLRDAVDAEGLRGFHSAPVTPCQTPLGSRQGSPKAERKKAGGLLGAIFGAGIYGRQTSEGHKPGLLGHLAEDNEDDLTPVGSPSGFTIDELKTRLRGVDEDIGGLQGGLFGTGGGGGGIVTPTAVANANKMKKKERASELDYSYRELNAIAPSSM